MRCFATSWLSRWNATASWLTIGSCIAAMAVSSAGSIRSVSMRSWWWSVPNSSAMTSEYLNSSPSTLFTDSKPIENVASPFCPAWASRPTMRLESSPPDSSTPTGTSAIMRRSTASRSAASTASSQSRADQSALPGSRLNGGSQ